MVKVDDSEVFRIDAGFGERLTVSVYESDDNGGGFVQMYDVDRDAIISIDFDVWDRLTKAVSKKREQ